MRRVTDSLWQEAKQHERVGILFKTLAASAPFGLAFWTRMNDSVYIPTWSNTAWNDLSFIREGENPTVDMEKEKERLPLSDWAVLIHPEDHHVLQANWQALMRGTTIGHMQFRVLRKHHAPNTEGAYRWLLMHSSHHYHSGSALHSMGAW
jgi:hypothetical protein